MEQQAQKKRVFSGIQPTGGFTLGNYIGALRNWDALQDEYACLYSVVDLHSLTVRYQPDALRAKIFESACMLLACGVDPARSILFVQGDVAAHTELAWILSCYTQFGELSRMTQFKDKSQKHPENINAGLFDYPVLMAADILLYDTSLVPIGDDQKQHLELSRNIALRFNHIYGDVFTVPEGYFPKVGARIMSLQEPETKMSKSDENVNARIMLTDDPDTIIKKFKRAVTDSDNTVKAAPEKPGITNLMTIYSVMTGSSFDDIEAAFAGKGYGDFKVAVGESVVEMLRPIHEIYHDMLNNKDSVFDILKTGSERAADLAATTMDTVRHVIGLK